jgi:hypothetical protein
MICGSRLAIPHDYIPAVFLDSFQGESGITLESLEKTIFSFAYRQAPKYLMGTASPMGCRFYDCLFL